MKGEFDLKRLEITKATRTWLEWKARTTGKTHVIALQKIKAAKVFVALAPTEDHSGDSGGRGS